MCGECECKNDTSISSMKSKVLHLSTSVLLRATEPFVYVSTCADRPALVAFAGTRNVRDLLYDDLDVRRAPWPDPASTVHGGFARRTSVLLRRLEPLLVPTEPLLIAGHSMGGACAVLAAWQLSQSGHEILAVHTFGMPRMASRGFVKQYAQSGLAQNSTHYATPRDPIVHTLRTWRPLYPYHKLAPYTTLPCASRDPWAHHDMRAYHAAVRV